jgi:ABC-type branched-subunit amino acid transport system ATPase component
VRCAAAGREGRIVAAGRPTEVRADALVQRVYLGEDE